MFGRVPARERLAGTGSSNTNRGEPAVARHILRRILVFGWVRADPDHEAFIRFGSKAPR